MAASPHSQEVCAVKRQTVKVARKVERMAKLRKATRAQKVRVRARRKDKRDMEEDVRPMDRRARVLETADLAKEIRPSTQLVVTPSNA